MFKLPIITTVFISSVFCTIISKSNAKNILERIERSPQYDWLDWFFDYSDEDYSFENSNVTINCKNCSLAVNGENFNNKNPTTQQPTTSTTQQQTTTIEATTTVMAEAGERRKKTTRSTLNGEKRDKKNSDKKNNEPHKITLQDGKLVDIFEKCINVNTPEDKNAKANVTENSNSISSKPNIQSVIKCIYGEVSIILADPYEVNYNRTCLNALNKLGKDKEIKLGDFTPEALKCFKDK